ncbi:MAG: carboxypeptidase-like regulatory domain-containing protein, partial [Bacteroidota bacterium]
MIYPFLPNVAARYIRFGFLFFVVMGCLCQGASHAGPPGHIRGIVSGAKGKETLPGVHVYLLSTGSGVVTNNYGYYSIAVAALPDTLVFSYVGFETQKHVITSQSDNR